MKKALRFLHIVIFALSLSGLTSNAQQIDVGSYDFKSINVDNLTDDQVRQFLSRAQTTGMSMQELEAEAISRGMPYDEIMKLRERIATIDSGVTEQTKKDSQQPLRETTSEIDKKSFEEKPPVQKDSITIFGHNLFKRTFLTFEPNLNIPTPPDYQIGPGDEIVIEVWGASQQSARLSVSPEGQITIPNLGPVQVSGQTVKKASELIINRLSSIYAGLKGPNPNTFAQISLGNIRSINVTVAGDAFLPGTYTLPAFATAFNALYFAGGPSESGTFREIKVFRNDEEIATIDLYDFLIKGKSFKRIRLQNNDLIFIEPFKNKTKITGEVIRPAIYEMRKQETLDDLINYTGGLTSEAYSKQLVVSRKTDKERELLNVPSELFSSFLLENGDEIKVGEILDRYENRVTIKGAVFREGEYALTDNMTLSDLIKKAEGLREDAFTHRAAIYRLQDNLKLEVIDVNLEDILSNDSEGIMLKREDLVYISSILELQQKQSVRVVGEVQKPGKYPYADRITLGEIVRKAGGLKDAASLARVEVARSVKDRNSTASDNKMSEVFTFPLDENLSLTDQASSFELEPFDMIFIRRSPGYSDQILVEAKGEVVFPGNYAIIKKNERISDLISRAGGITAEGYLPGATLLRKLDDEQKEKIQKIDSLRIDDSELNLNESYSNYQPIGIDLEHIMKNPHSSEDLFLMEGDIIKIPQELQTVRLNGAVLNPVITRYQKNRGVRNYVSSAGGFAENAKKSKVFVIYPNGSVDRTRNYILFKSYPKVEPGAEIIVPEKPPKKERTVQETLSIGSTLSSIALVIVTIIGQL
ncbi:MAG: SLBB domain-containing protein [Bacteroidales bacterium]